MRSIDPVGLSPMLRLRRKLRLKEVWEDSEAVQQARRVVSTFLAHLPDTRHRPLHATYSLLLCSPHLIRKIKAVSLSLSIKLRAPKYQEAAV
jgi:transposase